MNEAKLVEFVHAAAFGAFFLFLAIGAMSVGARVAFYRAKGFPRPRLLNRDAVFMLGFALSFGLVLSARVVDIPNLRDNLWWALLTDIPAIIAVATFVYFEVFVIERGSATRPEIRDFRGSDAVERVHEEVELD